MAFRFLLPSLLVLPIVLPAAVQKKGEPEAPAVTPQMIAPLESVAKDLAKGGREEETQDLLRAIQLLGYPEKNFEKLEETCEKSLAKAKKVIDSLPAGARQLRATAQQLVAVMNQLEGAEKLALAHAILRLDGEQEAARQALQHVKVGSSWVPEKHKALRERRAEIFSTLSEAKKLEIEIETGECDEPLVEKYCGHKATFARRGQLELRTNFSAEKTARILREALRAYAMSRYLRDGSLKLPTMPARSDSRRVWVLFDSREKYKQLVADVIANKEVSEEEARILDDIGGFNHKSGVYVMLAQFEAPAEATLLNHFTGLREGSCTALSAGHLNWVTLSCLGTLLPGVTYKNEPTKLYGETRAPLTEDEKRDREERMRLANAGIAGSRSWMRYLAERGEDPRFSKCLVDRIGKLAGNDLHKSTSIVDFLQESDRFAKAYKLLSSNPTGKVGDLYEKSIEMSLVELESDWREWIVGGKVGVAERIDKKNERAFPPDALAVLEHMNTLRRNAFKGRVEGLRDLKFDPELSEWCGLHADYLVLNPEQGDKWPDAHEEYSEKEGFTVEGAWAGGHSVVMYGNMEDCLEAVDGFMGTFYHRLPLIDPGLLRIGWGWAGEFVVMDTSSLAAPYDKNYVVLWPHDGQRDVPTSFSGNEHPDPVPEVPNEWEVLGYPITLQTNPVDDKGAVEISMRLYKGNQEVDCWFSTPQAPTNPESAPAGAWCLLPKAALELKTDYRVVARWTSGREVSWTFRTN